jgi:hypothetical protein
VTRKGQIPLDYGVPRNHALLAFVAQRIEHLTTDQKVGGSSPSKRTFRKGSSPVALDAWDKATALSANTEIDIVHCPVCQLEPGPQNICWAIVSPWIRELGVTNRRVCRYLICEDCKLGWFSLRYSAAGLENLYKNYRSESYTAIRNKWESWYDNRYNESHENPDWIKSRAEAILSFLSDKVDLSSSEVVDIGGDTGQIAELLGARSFRVVEISDRSVARKSQSGSIQSIAVLAHVLEHVSFPKEFLANLLGNYNSVYVEVPHGIPIITARRKSLIQLALGLIFSFFPFTWKLFANPSAGRLRPAQLLRVSEHLTFFDQSSFMRFQDGNLKGLVLASCRTLEIPSPDRTATVSVIQALWKSSL